MGIIAQRALYWWRFLPPAAKSYYDAEDMIAEAVLHVHRRDLAGKYKASRARETTWVWHVADNYCKVVLGRYCTQKLAACETVELTAVVERSLSVEGWGRTSSARGVVEAIIAAASRQARDLLDQLLCRTLRARPDAAAIVELRQLAAQHKATLEDFELVYRNVAR